MTDIRFGIWALVSGAVGSLFHPDDAADASWERNRRLVVEAEALGFESTLVAQHLFHVRDDERDQLETWTACAALAAVTERIEIIAAIKPALFHPAVLAKMATQIEEISQGRFAINFVNAWYKPEFERTGIPFAAHDDRYAYGAEWLRVFRTLSSGDRTDFAGEHFAIDGLRLRPAGRYRPRPPIYAGGESAPAKQLAVDLADVWFLNGQSFDKVWALIDEVRARPRKGGPLRFAMSAFVIARETDAEADEAHLAAMELARQDAPLLAKTLAAADPANVMFKPLGAGDVPQVGTNGGTAAGLVGSYDTVAARIQAFHAAGVELFMLQFQPFEVEMRRFAAEVRPRVARLAREYT